MQQIITKYRCPIQEMLRNAEAETTECYKMLYKLILTRTFRDNILHSIN